MGFGFRVLEIEASGLGFRVLEFGAYRVFVFRVLEFWGFGCLGV